MYVSSSFDYSIYSSYFTCAQGDIVKGTLSHKETQVRDIAMLYDWNMPYSLRVLSTMIEGLKMVIFFQLNHFSFDIKYLISTRWLANPKLRP